MKTSIVLNGNKISNKEASPTTTVVFVSCAHEISSYSPHAFCTGGGSNCKNVYLDRKFTQICHMLPLSSLISTNFKSSSRLPKLCIILYQIQSIFTGIARYAAERLQVFINFHDSCLIATPQKERETLNTNKS